MVSPLHARFKSDSAKAEKGVWVNFGGGDPEKGIKDVRVLVRRLNSKFSQDVRAELDRPFQNEIRRGVLPEATAKDLAVKQVAKGLIADWDGVTEEDGTEIAYTPENAYRLLKELPDFADSIIEIAMNAENFKAQLDEAAEKN